jgi:hypothetical protein
MQWVCIFVGIKDPAVPKTDTLETENFDKEISFHQKGASMYLLQLSRHVHKHIMAGCGSSLYP